MDRDERTRAASLRTCRQALRIGEVLVEEGILTEEQLEAPSPSRRATGRMLGEMLVEQGVINGAALVHAAGADARRQGLPAPPRPDRPDAVQADRRGRGRAAAGDPDVQGARHAHGRDGRAADRCRRSTACASSPVQDPPGAGAGIQHHASSSRSTPAARRQRRRVPHQPLAEQRRRGRRARERSTRARPPTWTRWSRAARSSTWSTSRC